MSPTRTPDQLARMVRELLRLPAETEWVEDKEGNKSPEEIGRYISALSNGAALTEHERGYLLWGVRDGVREIVGTDFDPGQEKVGNENLENWLLRHLAPQVHFTFHEALVEGKRVVVLEIDRPLQQPVTFKNEAYIRIGSYRKRLSEHPDVARRLWKSFVLGSFEDGIAADQLTASDVVRLLDYPAYFRLMKMPLPENRSGILDSLAVDGLASLDQAGVWRVTNLGAMLFALDLNDFPALQRKAIRVMLYEGNNRVKTLKEQEGVHGYAAGFAGLVSYVNELLPSNEVIGQALRQTVKMYPELAIRELVANALIHQDFHLSGSGPTVEIFKDRIEITNPGKPLVDPLRFVDSPPLSRNEKMGRILRRAGICEERGSGWDKVGFEIEFNQLPAPLVEVTQEHTRVTVFSHRNLRDMDKADRVRAVYLHACLRFVSSEKMTNTSIRERFGIDPRNSAKASRIIKEAVDQRLIVLRDPQAPLKLREYVPWWAGPELS